MTFDFVILLIVLGLIRNQTAWNTVKLILLDMLWLFSSFKVMNVHAKIQHKIQHFENTKDTKN